MDRDGAPKDRTGVIHPFITAGLRIADDFCSPREGWFFIAAYLQSEDQFLSQRDRGDHRHRQASDAPHSAQDVCHDGIALQRRSDRDCEQAIGPCGYRGYTTFLRRSPQPQHQQSHDSPPTKAGEIGVYLNGVCSVIYTLRSYKQTKRSV